MLPGLSFIFSVGALAVLVANSRRVMKSNEGRVFICAQKVARLPELLDVEVTIAIENGLSCVILMLKSENETVRNLKAYSTDRKTTFRCVLAVMEFVREKEIRDGQEKILRRK
jgi:hypothetical protein